MTNYRENYTSGETYFFRDKGQFSLIRLTILPELISRNKNKKSLRIWSAGCATGEEAYSIGILLYENYSKLAGELEGWNVVIIGTDINADAIKKAREGYYSEWSLRGVDNNIREQYFKKVNNKWLLEEHIRKMVRFEVLDIITDSYPNYGLMLYDMDMILCRNVFIYFDPEVTSKVVGKMTDALGDDSYLITGHAEMSIKERPFLKVRVFPEAVIYQKDAKQRIHSLKVRKEITIPLPTRGKTASENRSLPLQVKQKLHRIGLTDELLQQAKAYADSGKYDLAIKLCKKVVESAPFNAEPYYLLSQISREKGDLEEEKEMLKRVIYLAPSDVATYLELGIIYENEGNTAKSEKMRTTALELLKTMPRDALVKPYTFTVKELIEHVENMVI